MSGPLVSVTPPARKFSVPLKKGRAQFEWARTLLEMKRRWAHINALDTPARKIDQLISDARIELKRLGIETKGKRSDELLKMVREQRNKLRVAQLKLQ